MSHGDWMRTLFVIIWLNENCLSCHAQEQACDMTHTQTHTSCMCVFVSMCLCLCARFCHVLPVIHSPMIMVNTGRFQVRLTRARVGCHLLSPLPQIKQQRGIAEVKSISLSPSLSYIMSKQERGEEGKMRHCCIRFVKACSVRLVSHIWIAQFRGLVVASSEEAVWTYKRQTRCPEFAGSVPLPCVYTIRAHKNIGSICICFVWREMFCHRQLEHDDVLQGDFRETSSMLIKSSLSWIHLSILNTHSLCDVYTNQVITLKSGYFGSRSDLIFKVTHL